MKKFTLLLIGLSISFSSLFLIPFIVYWASKFLYFIGALVDRYTNFLNKYFESDSVELLVVASAVVFVATIFALIVVLVEEQVHTNDS